MTKLIFMKSLLLCLCFLSVFSLSSTCQVKNQPHFNHLTVYVTDLARSTKFYRFVMLQDTIPEPFHDGRHTWFKITEHGELHVVSGAKEDIPHDINVHLAFSVPDLQDFKKHLDLMGMKYGNWAGDQGKIQVRPDKINQIYLQDPDGYWIEVNDDKF